MRITDLGLIAHDKAEAIQMQALAEVLDGGEERLFLLEHPPTITLGRNGGRESLLCDPQAAVQEGIAVRTAARGGNVTCHYPGQLVAYPVMRLDKRPGGIRRFFFDLEECLIRCCAAFGVAADRREGFPGVWTGRGKIASMGIGVKRWVSYHGVSLNVSSDVSLFSRITLCGIAGASPTSLSGEAGREIPVNEVKDVFSEALRAVFAHSSLAAGAASLHPGIR